MDFKSFKEKLIQKTNNLVDYSAKKLASSSLTIQNKEDLDKMIEKSKETTFVNKETKEEKKFSHRSLVIFSDEKSDFFKKALYILPVISIKAFSQNVTVKLAKSVIEWVDLKKYEIDKLPALVVFENEKLLKVIFWEENILKLVKSFDLDINKEIDNIK